MSIKPFEDFRFSEGDEVIIKETGREGIVTQCRYEIVSNKKGEEYVVATIYQVNYGDYSQKVCKEDEIKYPLDLEPESEMRVLYEIMDVELMNENFEKVKEYNDARNKLMGDKK